MLSHSSWQVLAGLLSILLLTLLIVCVKLHPFLAILCATIFLALAIQMPADRAVDSFTIGVGATLGHIVIVLGLGAILGEMLAASGGAETIATFLLSTFGEKRLPWAMLLLGFVVGMPVFFEVGLVLLIPIALTVAKRSGCPPVAIALPMLAGLSVVHGLVPPHPAALLAMNLYHADIAKGILFGIFIGLPAAVLAGPMYLWSISRTAVIRKANAELLWEEPAAKGARPGIVLAASITLLPVFLILTGSLADRLTSAGGTLHNILHILGIPAIALLIAVFWSFAVLFRTRGYGLSPIAKFAQHSLPPMAGFLFLLGAAGGYTRMLQDSGIAATIVGAAMRGHMSLVLLAWLIAAGIRLATGSATIAMTTSATIVATAISAAAPGASLLHPELLAIASGSGSLIFSHVNDGGFWMVQGFLKLTMKETFATWSVMETILSVCGLVFALLLSVMLPA